ncbi:Peptidyl-tRNA hydrolase 2, mitochondrial [Exaiptasia diaphana]|nr:Peptidyl-tRNA hydrolase 2, mitochondrial [Exaiptasia diaphana]
MAVEIADLKVFLTLLFSESAVYYGIVLGLVLGILTGWLAKGMFCKDEGKDSKVVTYKSDGSGEYKMVLVVRQDLGMGKGKVAAQVCHHFYALGLLV